MKAEEKFELYSVLQDLANELRRIEQEDREQQKRQQAKSSDAFVTGGSQERRQSITHHE